MASAARIPSRNTTTLPPGNPPREAFLYPPLPITNFPMDMPLEQRERLRALEARQREVAMNRRFGEEMDRERALLFDRERVERMIERHRMGPRIGGPSRMFERERMGGVERPIVMDRRMDGPLGVLRLESGSGASRLENIVGLDRRPENPVGVLGADRRLENGVERGLSNPVAVERRLEAGIERRLENTAGIERRMESGVDRRLEPAVEGDDNRNVSRPPGRPATFERMRSTDRDREEERDKLRDRARDDEKLVGSGEKQKERDDSAGAMQELVAQYKTALAELTFNSKPIITNLTIIAGENLHASKVIAATVCAHILEVPIEQKLPSLYLLDSIVKNIGSSYVKHFAARLPEVFVKAYRQVDPATYPAMQHLFKTWRGVFPIEPLRTIEAELQFNFMVNGTSSSNPTRSEESPTQRPGHSIHVNPKYLEAQRQKLQQSTQANNLPAQTQRSDSVSGEANPLRKSVSNISDYDYSSADPVAEGGGTSGGREKPWERWPREGGEDSLRTPESSSSTRYGLKNGYELRQPSPRALVDAYGNIRGIRTSRFPPVPVQPTQDFDGRARNLTRNWQNSEEEEYIWEDISPRLLDISRHGESLRKEKDDWYPGDADKNAISGGALGGSKPFGLDQPLSDHPGWRRHGPLSSIDRPAPIDSSRVMREMDERAPLSNLQQDIVPRIVPDSVLEASALGPSGRPMMASRPMAGRLPHPLAQQPSPPSQSRLRPFQMGISSRNSPPSGLGSINQGSQAINLMGPTSNSGTSTIQGPALAGRSSVRPNMGSLGGGLLNYGSLSPVTPASGLNFHHRQQPQRPPSPPPLASLSQRLLPPPSLNPPLQHQPNLPAVPQHVISSKPVHHQGQTPGMQPHSSQQPISLPPLLQQPQHMPQQPLHSLQPQQMLLSQSTAEQVPSQQPSQTVTMPPQLPAQLLESLQQLQHHLPPLSGTLPQASQPLRTAFQLQQSQSTQQPQQSQKPLPQPPPQQPPQPPQSHATPPTSSVMNDNPSTLLSGAQNLGGTNNLLAAFLQSGLIPPSQASQMLSIPQSSSTNVPGGPSEPTIAQSSQVQPPLPSGPPPIQYPASGTGAVPGKAVISGPPAASTLPSNLVSLAPLPSPANLPPVYSSMRIVQPPLPPGPPPMSSQVTSSTSQLPSFAEPPAASGNNLTSLLSSLMAQGVISAPSSAPPVLPQLAGIAPDVSLGANFASSSINLLSSGGLPIPPSGSSAPLASVVSTTLVTAFRTQEPSSTATVAHTETGISDPSATEFRPEFLRERQEFIIKALYSDFPRQCKTCGLRFKHQEEHRNHMDWHVSKNRRQKPAKKVSRKWFVSVKEWLNGTGVAAPDITPSFFAEEVAVKSEDHEAVAVPADETQSACALCGEPFEDFYSDETDEWMYRGAVYMNAPSDGVTEGLDSALLGPIVHAKCRSESAATDLTEDAELEEEDGVGLRRKRVRY